MILRRTAIRIFRLTLRSFPPDRSGSYAAEMVDTFDRQLESREVAYGPLSAWRFAVAACIDAIRAGFGERRRVKSASRVLFVEGRYARRKRVMQMGMSWLDFKLGIRMLFRYPGLTAAAGLALAIAIGVGAGWFAVTSDLLRPTIPLPDGDRIVEIEMRSTIASEEERRILHDFFGWRQNLRSIEDLGAYRTIERNFTVGDSQPESMPIAEITASAFRVARVAPLHGRALLESDEHPTSPTVLVLGYTVWQQRFGGRPNAVGEVVQLGTTKATVVGVMPKGYAFPVNHRMWTALKLQPAGYAALEGVPVRVFGRLAEGATQAQANVEAATLVDGTKAISPTTHQHLRPRVLAYGGESPGDTGLLEFVITHLPIILVLLVACANVGTLIYARTATRDAEIGMRYALGATRGRIIGLLFVEALVLASLAAVVGLVGANLAIKAGMAAFYSGQIESMPFWVNPGLKPMTVLYAALLTIAGAAILGILPALKVTGRRAQAELRNAGAGGATLKFGKIWTTVMIAQVALTVICIPPAMGISQEAIRDRVIRDRFPTEQYLAVRMELDRLATATAEESAPAYAARREQMYAEFERRVAQQPGVRAVTFADRLPGMGPAVRPAEVEVVEGAEPLRILDLWMTAVGPRFFEAFDVPLVAGRDFHDGDRAPSARTVLVNEAFVRRYMNGASPVGRRVRYAAEDPSKTEPWFEIVGVVRDVGMTPTDLGEAPYMFRAVSAANARPLVMGVRVAGDPAEMAQRLRGIAAGMDAGLRLDDVRSLEDLAWRVDIPNVIAAGAIATVVTLGLFLSAAGIFSLMSVSVARRTREIGLRSALGAPRGRLLTDIFSRALVLVGSGVLAGNAVLLMVVALSDEVGLDVIWMALLITSGVMLTVGLLACLEPARRALRIDPTDALRET